MSHIAPAAFCLCYSEIKVSNIMKVYFTPQTDSNLFYYDPFVFAFLGYNIILLIKAEMLNSVLMWKQTGN